MQLRKKFVKVILLFGLIFGLAIQAAASTSSWRAFTVPTGSVTVSRDQSGNLLTRTTAPINTTSSIVSRQVLVESSNQTMWSTPEVRMHRSTSLNPGANAWNSNWHQISNNSYVRIDIPFGNDLTYTFQVRSSSWQNFENSAFFRMNAQRYRIR